MNTNLFGYVRTATHYGMLICLLHTLSFTFVKGQNTLIINQNTPMTLTGEVSLTFNDVSLVIDGDIFLLDQEPKTIAVYGSASADSHRFSGQSVLPIANFLMRKSRGGLSLQTDAFVFNQAAIEGGILVLEENAVFNLVQSSNASIMESEDSRITGADGSISTSLALNAPAAENVANLGLEISSTANLGNTEIIRKHSPVMINGSEGIARTFEINPDNNSNLDATLRFYYFDAELNGNDEAQLQVFLEVGADLVKQTVTDRNTDDNWIEIAAVDELGTFVIGADPCDLIDISVNLIGRTLTVSESGITYQWVDCDNDNTPIEGATALSFEAMTTGNYAVIVSTENCDVLSSCTFVDVEACNTTAEFTEEACDSFSWLDMTFTESGTYNATIPNRIGCDSLLTLNLTINTVDTEVSVSENTLTSAEQNATYQWLNCDDNNAVIAGATAQSFSPENSGNYAVEITSEKGCVATSDCQQLDIILGIESDWVRDITLYPNPVENRFSILLDQTYPSVNFQLRDARGVLIAEQQYENSAHIEYSLEVRPGVYFIELNTGEKRASLTIQKN
ncbi:MAG: T9SS type A sorting domain-containing protein [Bacteroidota bacterium]